MRLIDADAFDERLVRLGTTSIKRALDEEPTVDAVPMVRCRDCKYFMEYTLETQAAEGADGDCYFRVMYSNNRQFPDRKYGDYCSDGERRSDDEHK